MPVFALAKDSHPTKAQQAALCACIWQSLSKWERDISQNIAKEKQSEVPESDVRTFIPRFSGAFEKCGGMKL